MKQLEKIGCCPNCQGTLEIVCVRFGFRGTVMIFSCPNCAMLFPEGSGKMPNTFGLSETRTSNGLNVGRQIASLNSRARYVLILVIAAVITAAVLRHIVHVYGGVPREEIRFFALVALGAFVAVAILLQRRRLARRSRSSQSKERAS